MVRAAQLLAILLAAGLLLTAGATAEDRRAREEGLALSARCDAVLRGIMLDRRAPGDSLDFSWNLPPLRGVPAAAEIQAEPLQMRERGTCTVSLRLLEQGRCLRRLTVPVRVRRWDLLPVARRDILRGRVLEASDLEERWTETTHLADGDLPGLSEVLGRRLTRYLAAGRPIPARLLERVPDVLRGEPITLTVRAGGVRVSAAAEALEDGTIGRLLKVRLVETGRRMSARLTARGQADVEVSG